MAVVVASASPAPPPEAREPLVAGLLSAAGSAVWVGAGLGHLYAPDPARGLLVSLGGAAAPVAAVGLLDLANPALRRDENPTGFMAYSAIVWVGVMGAYGVWATCDAIETTKRANEEARRRGEPSVMPNLNNL